MNGFVEKRRQRRSDGTLGPIRWRARIGNLPSKTFDRKRDADAHLTQVREQLRRGSYVDPRAGKQPLSDFAADVMATRRNRRPASEARDETYLRLHVLTAFGKMALNTITPAAVQAWVNSLSDDKHLAPATVRECHRLLSGILAVAADADAPMIPSNPCRKTVLPRIPATERRFLTPDELCALEDGFDPRYAAWVPFGGYLGLRWGEQAGLKLTNLDLLKRKVRIVGTLERFQLPPRPDGTRAKGANGFRYSTDLKTENARRTLPIPAAICDRLAEHLTLWERSEWVFPNSRGGHLDYTNFRRSIWDPAVERSGIDYCTPHALRHTAAAIMIDGGANPLQVMHRLGHGNISVTLGTYGHRFVERDDQLTNDLSDTYADARASWRRPGDVVDLASGQTNTG